MVSAGSVGAACVGSAAVVRAGVMGSAAVVGAGVMGALAGVLSISGRFARGGGFVRQKYWN